MSIYPSGRTMSAANPSSLPRMALALLVAASLTAVTCSRSETETEIASNAVKSDSDQAHEAADAPIAMTTTSDADEATNMRASTEDPEWLQALNVVEVAAKDSPAAPPRDTASNAAATESDTGENDPPDVPPAALSVNPPAPAASAERDGQPQPLRLPSNFQPIGGAIDSAPAGDSPADDGRHPLEGKQAKLLYAFKGKQKVLDDVTIVSVDGREGAPQEASAVIEAIRFRLADEASTRRPRRIPAEQLVRVIAEDRPYDVRFDREQKAFRLIDVEEHLKEVDRSLRAKGHWLWPKPTQQDQDDAVAEYKKFIKVVNEAFGGRLQVHETDYFLFCTDIPASQVGTFINYLDAMYDALCSMFGVMPGENIWRGKAIVLAFRQESDFSTFERVFMGNTQFEGKAAGIHHGFRDGKVIIACYRGDDPAFFGQMLVHETSHGFLHRYKSNVHIPSWINEGIADWVGNVAVPQCPTVRKRRMEGRMMLAKTRTVGNNFFSATNIDGSQYGIASDLTDMMITLSPAKYRLFLDGIKEGKPWRESLLNSYGLTPEQLLQTYDRNWARRR